MVDNEITLYHKRGCMRKAVQVNGAILGGVRDVDWRPVEGMVFGDRIQQTVNVVLDGFTENVIVDELPTRTDSTARDHLVDALGPQYQHVTVAQAVELAVRAIRTLNATEHHLALVASNSHRTYGDSEVRHAQRMLDLINQSKGANNG